MSVKVFRFHDGIDIYGWDTSTPLNSNTIAAIEDPNGEHASREITSIPSPFARIDLVNTAFKEVANRDLVGETIYHKMVSDALDIGQILFDIDKYQDKIEIISWDPKTDLDKLLSSSNVGHRSLGESLRLFLEQDAKTYNFDKMHKLYLLNYKLGPNPINIIGGTSPISLFFTSANVFELNGFMSGNDRLLDDDFCPLHKRDEAFIEYIFLLSKTIPNFAINFKNLNAYIDKVFPLLTPELKSKINSLDKDIYNGLSNLSIDGGGEVVEVLKVNFKKSKGNITEIRKSDFILNSPNNTSIERPVLVLPNDIITGSFKYVTADWDTANKAPSYEQTDLSQRRLPFDGSQYPYLVISDFLEPVLIRTHLPIDDFYFKNGNKDSEEGYLFPLKPLYFKYFSIDSLRQNINGEKRLEIKTLSNGHVDVFLRLPIKNGKHITFKRTYYNPVNQGQTPEYNEEANKGAIIENKINLGITPFYTFPETVTPEYNVAFYDADSNPLFEGNKYNIEFYDSNNEVVSSIQKTQRRYKEEELATMYGLVVNKNFNYIQIANDYATGILVPKFENKVSGGSDQFTIAIDFGTTNTHIEYSKNEGVSTPFDLGGAELKHLGHLIDDEMHDEAFLKLLNIDLLPNIIQKDGLYEFPQRTVMAYHKKTNFDQPLFAMANIAIPFQYEKGSFAVNTEIKSNIKWNREDNSGAIMQSFFEQLIKMIRNKILLNNGDLNKTKIIWSYPASMMTFELNSLEQRLNSIIEKHLGSVDVTKVCESLTPFYYYINEKGKAALEKPIASIDIGGGTADTAIYIGNDPILFTSYKFAGDAIFGDNYNRNIKINGFVQRYTNVLTDKLKQNGLADLANVMSSINSRNNSNDAINGLFSIESHKQVKDKKVNISFLEALKADRELNMIFLLFYAAHVFHLAQVFKARGIKIPAAISFSGTASKLLTILDESEQKSLLKRFAELIFYEVFDNTEEKIAIEILLEDNPKEIASKGAIYYTNTNQVELKDISEILINHNTLASLSPTLTYDDIEELEVGALQDYESFLEMFFKLDDRISFKEFGIDRSITNYTKSFLDTKKVNAMKMGIQEKRNELENHTGEKISETLFFYPLVGCLGELAYDLVNKK